MCELYKQPFVLITLWKLYYILGRNYLNLEFFTYFNICNVDPWFIGNVYTHDCIEHLYDISDWI